MRKLKIKIIFIILVFAFSFKGYSQAAVSSNMSVGATLLQLMVINATEAEMNFGMILHTDVGAATVVIGTDATAMAAGEIRTFSTPATGTANSAGTSDLNADVAQRAVYTIQGSSTHSYSITLNNTSVLLTREIGTGETGPSAEQMTVDKFTAWVQDEGEAVSEGREVSFTGNAGYVVIQEGMAKTNPGTFIGQSLLSFGATLNIGANQRGGKYSITNGLTVSVNYE